MDHVLSNFTVLNSTTMIVLNAGHYGKQQPQQQQQRLRKYTIFRLFCTLFYLGWWWSCLFSCCCRSQAIHNKTSTATMMTPTATSAINSQKWSTQHTLSPSTQSISGDDDDEMMMKSTVINGTRSWYLNKIKRKPKELNR